jgi:hypothetical protein
VGIVEGFEDMVDNEVVDFTQVTMQELDGKIRELRDVRNSLDEIEQVQVKPLKERKGNLEGWITACLDEHKKKSYKSCYGDISVATKASITVPKSTDDKDSFREYLEGRGLFNAMWSLHSVSLNKWYNDYLESCEVKGELPEPIPGLGEPVIRKTLRLKRK